MLAPKQETNVDPSAGFVAKAASAVVIQPTEPKKEVVSNLEPVLATLADRVAKVEMSPSLGQNLAKVEKPGPKLEDAIKDTAVKILPPTGSKAISKESKLVPATPAKKTSAPAIKVDSVPASGLFVQVGAPDSFAKAQSMVTNLKARGITAAIRDASVNNKLHYRVLVGPFSSRDSAQNAKNQVIKSGVALGEPFIKNY